MKTIGESLALAALIIATSLGIIVAQKTGVLSVDTGTRVGMLINTLVVAYFGNLIPKAIVPNERARAARRFAGWALASTGLVSAGLWIFAPIDVATPATIALIGTAVVVVFGYCLFSRGAATS
jgi:CBS domain containing-hemolysin-like protein